MNFNKNINKYLLLIPAIVMFLIALIPTLKYQWPLSWDIIYHVQYAKVYAQYGFVLTNPLLNAPFGQNIGYPPLFHFLIACLGSLLKIDFFQIARFLQPILAMFIVLSVSYVATKFYGRIAGISAGFLMISSYLIHRITLPIPENLALIFLPLAVYFYYRSLKEGIMKYALIAGFLFLVIISTHMAAALCLFLVITSFTILGLILNKDLNILKNYGTFLIFLIALIIGGLITLFLLKPDLFYSILNQGLSAIGYGTTLYYNKSMNILTYFKSIGYIVLIFAAIGLVFAIKKMQKKNIYIIIWIVIMFLLSKAYWFGINVISYRVLIYLLIPLSILGGFGLSQIYYNFKENKKIKSARLRSIFLIAIFILSSVFGILTVNDPKIANFGANTEFGYIQIAPPTASEVDLAKWFNENGDKNKSILISNLYSGFFIAAESGMPIHKRFEYFNKSTPKSTFEKEKIGYIVYDKRLTFQSADGKLYMKIVNSDFSPLYYYSKDIHTNINEIIPDYAKVVYENDDFIICEIITS